MKTNIVDFLACIIVIIGALNWGLIGLFHFNLVETIFSSMPTVIRATYIIVGLCGLWAILLLFKSCGKSSS